MITRDIEVDGYCVSAGTLCVIAFYAMHRDSTEWEYPLDFQPDRFSPDKVRNRNRWQYLPFGGGPRSCLGDHFAVLEATLALATIIGQFEVHSLGVEFPLCTPFTMAAAEPIHARVTARSITCSG